MLSLLGLLTATLAWGGSSIVGRVLLYMTTYDNPKHLHALQSCWPTLFAKSALLSNAALLVYIDGEVADMEAWTSAVRSLSQMGQLERSPQNETSGEFIAHGYQPGAMYAMHRPFEQHWFDGYDWVIRINPDVFIYNDTNLFALMSDQHTWGIFANCAENNTGNHSLTQTDFFAVRPKHLNASDFAEWHTQPNAEAYFTQRGVTSIWKAGKGRWLVDSNRNAPQCRIQGGGIWHYHGECVNACLQDTSLCTYAERVALDERAERVAVGDREMYEIAQARARATAANTSDSSHRTVMAAVRQPRSGDTALLPASAARVA